MFSDNDNIKNMVSVKRYVCDDIKITCFRIAHNPAYFFINFNVKNADNIICGSSWNKLVIKSNGVFLGLFNIKQTRYDLKYTHIDFNCSIPSGEYGNYIIKKLKEEESWFVTIDRANLTLIIDSI